MNELVDKYASKGLSVIGFPCNQFGHQENTKNGEVLTMLQMIRPGNGFVPKIKMAGKIEVNGAKEHALMRFLKTSLPFPCDDNISFMSNPSYITWNPVSRADIAWNFEKFLIDRNGKPVKRYSSKFETKDLQADIEKLLASSS